MPLKILLSILALCVVAFANDNAPTWTVEQAMSNLQKGNERFVKGKPKVWDSGSAKREHLAAGQAPYACIISCSDSRVPPEQVFDASLGELFVIRVAGNVTPKEVLASADYAVGHLHCPVVLVMGHTKCGAVGAALSESDFPEPLNSLVNEIRPSVEACQSKGYGTDDLYSGVIKENARAGASTLISGSRAIEQAVSEGKCVVLSAVYDIETGKVSWQSQLSAVTTQKPEPESHPVTEAPKAEEPKSDPSHKSVAKTERKDDKPSSEQSQANRKNNGSKYKH